MTKPLLIIIAGPPATGKTTLGKRVATELGLPFVNKDGIKEILFDRLGWGDRERSRELSLASYAILDYFIGAELRAGRSLVVESTFQPERDNLRFVELGRKYDFEPFQIQCVADGETLYRRFIERHAAGQRHPGHVDDLTKEEFKPILLKGRYEPLDIGGKLYELDTTDLDKIDYTSLIEAIRATWGLRT